MGQHAYQLNHYANHTLQKSHVLLTPKTNLAFGKMVNVQKLHVILFQRQKILILIRSVIYINHNALSWSKLLDVL